MVTQRFSVPFSLSPFLSPNPSSPTATEPFIQQATGNTPHPSSSPPISSPIGLTPTVRSQYPYYPSLSPGEDARPRNTDQPRQQSLNRAIPRLDCNLPEVKQWVNQCYHCGQLGHLMHACPRKHLPRIAEHEYDWRYVKYDNFTPATKLYSVMALWPKSQPLAPRTV
ncbi:uncharacterized protein MELLADRAFT_68533 [Melampsora larici-populina 98AG31]|uniref:CCHC-type domain-containing protein n=1 Tax=Melampsora larici-populina (strain 98AG31 / pathotype 3-4-7) TaxID=747676 RepID=F4S753_MELLP|nr:uncharacterized protein MELLADRAFT_68533 [Melampsora larici-populina 98AG31]EGF99448.1 hypothetical protein MELLADRAFT_68533 [Melampsora larici-populina 98AG31]